MKASTVPRVMNLDGIAQPELDALRAASQLYLDLPTDVPTQAISVVGGLGEEIRYKTAVDRWNNSDAEHLFVAAANPGENTYREPTLDTLEEYYGELRNPRNVHILPTAYNTPDQARWVADKLAETGAESTGLVVTEFHIVRAACTLAKTLQKRGGLVPVLPSPVEDSLDMIVPEVGEPASTLVPGEARRMINYGKKGDVLTADELTSYVEWMRTQPPLAK